MQTFMVLLLLVVFLSVGSVIARFWGFYRKETQAKPGERFASLDGFRGFLALAVFLHHADATHHDIQSGHWLATETPLHLMGPVAVIFFFMITGFLFWLKAIKGGGRVPVLQLYRGRALRIAPLYMVSAVAMLVIVLCITGLPLKHQMFGFIAGASRLLFGIGIVPLAKINGYDPSDINGSVLWTLHSEWTFYLLLPLLAFLARPWGLAILAALIAAVYAEFCFRLHTIPPASPILFLCGMTAAQLIHSFGPQRWATGKIASFISLAIIAAVVAFFKDAYTLAVYAILFAVIYSLVNGGTLYGLLATRGARALGAMSYSIYLLHAIALFLARPLLKPLVTPGEPSVKYWIVTGLIGVAVIAISAVTYRFVEYPFIAWEHRLKRAPRQTTQADGTLAAVPA